MPINFFINQYDFSKVKEKNYGQQIDVKWRKIDSFDF